jgi:hypothetical protein
MFEKIAEVFVIAFMLLLFIVTIAALVGMMLHKIASRRPITLRGPRGRTR